MNQFGLEYINACKCRNETPYIAILNKQKCLFFFKNGKQEGKTGPAWRLVPVREGRYKQRV
jgi:hypothetical protein